MKHEQNLIWIDLEMTGLNPEQDVILEIATIITDNQLNILAEGPVLTISQSSILLDTMNDWCKQQHEKSGLTQEVKDSTITVQHAEEQTLDFIRQYCFPTKSSLAGNSVWQDRIFMQKYMPKLIAYMNYRLIDVTSFKEMLRRWYPQNPYLDFKKSDKHRALPDIRESIEELKHYRAHFFIQPN